MIISLYELVYLASPLPPPSPNLVRRGSAVYQPSDPINIVYDMFAIPASLIRGVWDPLFLADALWFRPHVPGNFTASFAMEFPIIWGPHRLLLSTLGNAGAEGGAIATVTVDGLPLPASQVNTGNFSLVWAEMPPTPSNLSVVVHYVAAPDGTGVAAAAATSAAAALGVGGDRGSRSPALHPLASPARASRALRALVPAADTVLWLDAEVLQAADGSLVQSWPDSSPSHASVQVAQSNASIAPLYYSRAMNGRPAVVFEGLRESFLEGVLSGGLPSLLSIFAVFVDGGETTDCCSGIFFAEASCAGLGTRSGDPNNVSSVLMIDYSGSPDGGADDLRGRQVVASVVYNASGAYSYADGCLESVEAGITVPPAPGPAAPIMVGSRGDFRDRYFNGTLSELIVVARALNDTEREGVEAYLSAKWPRPERPLDCHPPPNCTLPQVLASADSRLASFVQGMRTGGFADGTYELAHALLALESTQIWVQRCAGINNGTIPELASHASEVAADALYVSSATNLALGLETVLNSYANSTVPVQRKIYSIWEQTGGNRKQSPAGPGGI